MKHHKCLAAMIFLFVMSLLNPALAGAAVQEVTFFPSSAQVTETLRLKVHQEGNMKKAILILPSQADPESLVARLNAGEKLRITDQTWRQIERTDDGKIKELRQKIESSKNERINLQAALRALETQIQFWQMQTKAKVKSATDAANYATAIRNSTKKAYQDKLTQEQELEKLNKRIKELEDALHQAAGNKETALEMTILLAGPHTSEVSLNIMYNLSGCGWAPLYRLEARPPENRILFSWEAEIWQSSGRDWNQALVKLATLQTTAAIAPQELPPWIIKPKVVIPARKSAPKGARAEAAALLKENADAAEDASLASPQPVETRQSTYSIWELGKTSVPAGIRQRVKVQEESWTAEFVHLLRPSLSGRAFLRGLVNFEQSRDIPQGQAIIMVDGAILGKRAFAFAGKELNVFFGADPLVMSTVDLLTRQTGEKTFLADKQTCRWEWQTEIQNRRNTAVRAWIEEAPPQSRDERIKITAAHNPVFSEQRTNAWVWKLDIPAGQKKSIRSSVFMEAPREMDIDLGWRK